ncbi:MAG: ATP-binding protein, partial [Pseudomonadota bacterium]
ARRARQLERANEELRLYREIIDRMPTGTLVLDWEAAGDPASIRTVALNPAFERAARVRASEVVGKTVAAAFPELLETELPDKCASALESGKAERLPELRFGDRVWSVQAVRLVGRKLGVLAEDITDLCKAREERDRMERQMHAAQRLEAIGKLAGGVAHDFNNLLTVVRVYGSALRDQLDEGDSAREDVEAILAATEQATRLTSQLLAFGRRQVQELTVVSLNQTIRDLERMLRRLIGEHIELVVELAPELGAIKADVTQMEQVIMNLVVNARDALPNGGRITIETREMTYEASVEGLTDVPPGRYVTMTVSDNGTGIDEATQARMFEPFFTTKERGRGTGLGLATVYGIVKQSGGTISVSSRVGEGTSVRVCLPRVDERPTLEPRTRKITAERGGNETVLLVEDEDLVRVATTRVLERNGYGVLAAASPSDAVALVERHSGPIHALITDVVMPQMNGRELARRVLARRPGLRVVYVSGYADDAMVDSALLDAEAVFLQKPFTPEALLRTLREVLAPPGEASGSAPSDQ